MDNSVVFYGLTMLGVLSFAILTRKLLVWFYILTNFSKLGNLVFLLSLIIGGYLIYKNAGTVGGGHKFNLHWLLMSLNFGLMFGSSVAYRDISKLKSK